MIKVLSFYYFEVTSIMGFWWNPIIFHLLKKKIDEIPKDSIVINKRHPVFPRGFLCVTKYGQLFSMEGGIPRDPQFSLGNLYP